MLGEHFWAYVPSIERTRAANIWFFRASSEPNIKIFERTRAGIEPNDVRVFTSIYFSWRCKLNQLQFWKHQRELYIGKTHFPLNRSNLVPMTQYGKISFSTLYGKKVKNFDFSPISCKKLHSTFEISPFKIMLRIFKIR